MILRTRFRRHVLMKPADDGGTGGGVVETPAVASPSPSPAPIEAQAVAAPAPIEAAAPAGPKSLLEAISNAVPTPSQPRDELGRFTFKDAAGNAVDAQGNPAPAGTIAAPNAPVAPAAQPTAPAVPEDPLAMPEGLQPKAQERFQKLANTNKELTAQLEQASGAIDYVQAQFREHGVQQPQFEQAVQVIGAINRGDFATAQRVLMEQLQQLSLLSGQPLSGMDPLSAYPDLRQRVDTLQLSESDAMEMAGLRQRQILQQQAVERNSQAVQQQRQQQQAAQAQDAAVQRGLADIEAFSQQMKAADMDFAAIEAQLLPILPELVKGLPPERWGAMVKLQYDTIKKTAGQMRQQAAPQPGTVLRPTGQASPSAVPRSMHEAMWGASPRA